MSWQGRGSIQAQSTPLGTSSATNTPSSPGHLFMAPELPCPNDNPLSLPTGPLNPRTAPLRTLTSVRTSSGGRVVSLTPSTHSMVSTRLGVETSGSTKSV